jgi:hypothetical protein
MDLLIFFLELLFCPKLDKHRKNLLRKDLLRKDLLRKDLIRMDLVRMLRAKQTLPNAILVGMTLYNSGQITVAL